MILEWLEGGSLRSDGMADEVVSFVLKNPQAFSELLQGLSAEQDVVRGRTADALEKIARTSPDRFLEIFPILIKKTVEDPIPMVRWHLAMLLGYLIDNQDSLDSIQATLLRLLQVEESVFVLSWAIVSLCLIGRMYPRKNGDILQRVVKMKNHSSAAIRTKVRMAMELLTDDRKPFPDGWVKSASQRVHPAYGLTS